MTGTVIVTGGTGGLGPAVLRRLLADDWRVVASVWGEPSEVPPGVEAIPANVSEERDVAGVVAAAAAMADRPLTAVVNLVGGYAEGKRLHETPIADFESIVTLNLRPTVLVTGAALPHLVANGGGSVVCVGSRAAVKPFPKAAGYIVGKAAVLALVDALAVEYRDDRVRVNAVLPSVIDTPGQRAANPGADTSRWVPPEEIADAIAFLCSDASRPISGAHMPVYGRA
jgi:NAD(P)-dependent dehydrogenase (short-subunit alcohol dehydrogenase family)